MLIEGSDSQGPITISVPETAFWGRSQPAGFPYQHNTLGNLVKDYMARQVGLELTTCGFGDRCSSQLSYWRIWKVKRRPLELCSQRERR